MAEPRALDHATALDDAIARGDWRAATTALMAAHGEAVYRFCRQMVGDDALAQDVLQQVFVTAYRDLPGFAGRSSVRTWLFGIARHRCLDAIKHRRRRDSRLVPGDEPRSELPDLAPDAHERLAHAQLARLLTACLDGLAPAVREAVLLRYREDFAYDEMAAMTGDKAGTLQQRVARALPTLRRCVEQRLRQGAE